MEMLTFDDSTQNKNFYGADPRSTFRWRLCTSCTHGRRHSSCYQRFHQIRTPFRTDDQSKEIRSDLSAKARSRLHSSNHHNRQQPTESHWQFHIIGQHDITERIDCRRDLGTDWQSQRVVRQTHQAPLERTRSAASYQNQCVLCGCATNSPVATWYPYIVNPEIMESTRFFDGFGFPWDHRWNLT